MQYIPLRLEPGDDLRGRLEALTRERGWSAAFVLAGIGSLRSASVRYAGRPQATALSGDLEILSLGGSLSPDGAHLHISVADANGRVSGGHVCAGCIVRTTAELLVAVLPAHRFARRHDATTGYKELHIDDARED